MQNLAAMGADPVLKSSFVDFNDELNAIAHTRLDTNAVVLRKKGGRFIEN